jgi:uncharacterized metal-binding protein
VAPDLHLILNRSGAKKRYGEDCSEIERAVVRVQVNEAATILKDQAEAKARPIAA